MNFSRGKNGGKQWVTNDPAIVAWLESAEGEKWSRERHGRSQNVYYQLMAVKDDMMEHENNEGIYGFHALLWYA